jgi:hypothetical protein
MGGQSVIRIAGKTACFLGIAFYSCVSIYMFALRGVDLSKHPEGVYFAILVSLWGALPFLLVWIVRRKEIPVGAEVAICVASMCMTGFEVWNLVSAFQVKTTDPRIVGGAMIDIPISLWPVGVAAILFAEVLYRWEKSRT